MATETPSDPGAEGHRLALKIEDNEQVQLVGRNSVGSHKKGKSGLNQGVVPMTALLQTET